MELGKSSGQMLNLSGADDDLARLRFRRSVQIT